MDGRLATRRRLLASGGAVAAGWLAGCLGDDHDPGELDNPEPQVEVELYGREDGARFDHAVVHLVDGGMVVWRNESGRHDVTALHPATHGPQLRIPEDVDPWASDSLTAPGDTFEVVFEEEGVYDYLCTRHGDEGMVGSVVVGWPEPDGEPGLAPPADDYPSTTQSALSHNNEQVRELLEEEHA